MHTQSELRGESAVIRQALLSARAGVRGVDGGALKVAVTAPLEKGKANEAVLDALAEFFGVPSSSLELLSGEGSRNKRVLVKGVTADDVRKRVAG